MGGLALIEASNMFGNILFVAFYYPDAEIRVTVGKDEMKK